jgi:hypothetical protein
MIQRLALFAASLAAALVIAGGLAVAGFGPDQTAAEPAVEQVASTPESPPVQVDTVYLTPQASPEQITVTKVKTAARSGENEAEHDGGDRGRDD